MDERALAWIDKCDDLAARVYSATEKETLGTSSRTGTAGVLWSLQYGRSKGLMG